VWREKKKIKETLRRLYGPTQALATLERASVMNDVSIVMQFSNTHQDIMSYSYVRYGTYSGLHFGDISMHALTKYVGYTYNFHEQLGL